MDAKVRSKALGYLRDGRLQVLNAYPGRGGVVAEVLVRGHWQDHLLEFDTVAWTCTCNEGAPCAHSYAADLVIHGAIPLAPRPGR